MSEPAWDVVDAGLVWSLVSGDVDAGGKARMVDALTHSSLAYLEELRVGFEITQQKNDKAILAFSVCMRLDGKRLYNIARSKLDLEPI
jgi:hypothetical protein